MLAKVGICENEKNVTRVQSYELPKNNEVFLWFVYTALNDINKYISIFTIKIKMRDNFISEVIFIQPLVT